MEILQPLPPHSLPSEVHPPKLTRRSSSFKQLIDWLHEKLSYPLQALSTPRSTAYSPREPIFSPLSFRTGGTFSGRRDLSSSPLPANSSRMRMRMLQNLTCISNGSQHYYPYHLMDGKHLHCKEQAGELFCKRDGATSGDRQSFELVAKEKAATAPSCLSAVSVCSVQSVSVTLKTAKAGCSPASPCPTGRLSGKREESLPAAIEVRPVCQDNQRKEMKNETGSSRMEQSLLQQDCSRCSAGTCVLNSLQETHTVKIEETDLLDPLTLQVQALARKSSTPFFSRRCSVGELLVQLETCYDLISEAAALHMVVEDYEDETAEGKAMKFLMRTLVHETERTYDETATPQGDATPQSAYDDLIDPHVKIRTIVLSLCRIYVHIYEHFREELRELELSQHLDTCCARLIAFISHNRIIDEEDRSVMRWDLLVQQTLRTISEKWDIVALS